MHGGRPGEGLSLDSPKAAACLKWKQQVNISFHADFHGLYTGLCTGPILVGVPKEAYRQTSLQGFLPAITSSSRSLAWSLPGSFQAHWK